MTSIPHTPTRATQYAPPPTPRSSAAREIKARHSIQATTTVTISAFASLITELTASYTSPSTPDEWTRLDMIETFREDFLCGGFQRSRPEEILEDAFSDGTRVSLGTVSSMGSKTEDGNGWPASAMQRGNMAEQTIKQHLRSKRALFKHGNFKSIAGAAVRCMTRVSATGQPVYLACGLLKSPHWGTEYGEQGWAAPGIRWGNFKPDLIKFSPKYKGLPGEMEWEVVEIKYSGNTRRIIYASYKIQAIYYHLALTKLLSSVSLLSPSHRVVIWINHNPRSPVYHEIPVALRTNLAYVEHHLFGLLPTWLHAVTNKEWEVYQETTSRIAASIMSPEFTTPAQTFLERLSSIDVSTPTRTVPSVNKTVQWLNSLPIISTLPPLPDEQDDDLADMLEGLVL